MITNIPFRLNNKPGVLDVHYVPNKSITESGFDLLAGFGFDVNMAIGYPTMRGYVSAYEGRGYYTASAWIQIVTRREFDSVESDEPAATVSSVDVNDTLGTLGVPFFAMGFPAKIFDAPFNNLGDLAKLEWIAGMFFVTMPTRINDKSIIPLAGFQWGYVEFDIEGKWHVEINPLVVADHLRWKRH